MVLDSYFETAFITRFNMPEQECAGNIAICYTILNNKNHRYYSISIKNYLIE